MMRRFFHSIAKAFADLIDRHGVAANTDATHTHDGFYLGRDGNVYNDDGSLKMKNPSPEVPGTLGDLFASVGGWMAGGELGYPSFGSMDALRIYTQRAIRAAIAGVPLPQTQSDALDAARLEFLITHEAWIAWSFDGESCRVFHHDDDGESCPMMGWVPEAWFHDPRVAIDATTASREVVKS